MFQKRLVSLSMSYKVLFLLCTIPIGLSGPDVCSPEVLRFVECDKLVMGVDVAGLPLPVMPGFMLALGECLLSSFLFLSSQAVALSQ
jgi:hypothetical protein